MSLGIGEAIRIERKWGERGGGIGSGGKDT